LPELPEVETVRRGLEKKLKEFIIKDVLILRSSTIAYPKKLENFIEGIKNSQIIRWERRGKYLIAFLQKALYKNNVNDLNSYSEKNGLLIIHLRMTGYFKWIRFSNSSSPCKHTRVRFFDSSKNELRFVDIRSFGQMWWIPQKQDPKKIIKGLGNLGPEPFSQEFNLDYLSKEFAKRKKTVKSVLLDQTIIAGIGNIYADESLFEAGISPFRSAETIKKKELTKLRAAIISVLRKSIGSGGTTFSDFRDIEGSNGKYSLQASVYKRDGKKCIQCGNFILRKKLLGRGTHWCHKCQK